MLYGHAHREESRKMHTKTNKQSKVAGPSGQNYAVAMQPGDSSKEPLHGRFPSLCEGIHSFVCAFVCLCKCLF